MQLHGWHNLLENYENASNSLEFCFLNKLYKSIIISSMSFFERKGVEFVMIPATTGSASSPAEPGSDSAPVKVVINNVSTMLMDSAQFHLEYACRAFANGCYYFGHSFRAETPDQRHLSQFFHIEAEIPGELSEVKKFVEEYIRNITMHLWNKCQKELSTIEGIEDRISSLIYRKKPFKTISFDRAYEILHEYEGGVELCAPNTYRITPKGEKILMEKEGDFLWVERWPKLAVPFYQAIDAKGHAINADLLFGIGEVVGAGQRHLLSNDLSAAIKEHYLDPDSYLWYIKMKQLAPMQTSGFGIGVERFLMWLLNANDIRDVEIFTRDSNQVGII